jgi:choline dehydrogenase-like flavoprotein
VPERIVSLNLKAHYDAIVIGSGAGGSAVAYRLALAGKQVLIVERGKELKPIEPVQAHSIGRYVNDEVNPGENAARFLGGQTKFYGSALYRLRESDFSAVEHETGISPAWPFPYSTLEPYYTEAERLYRVHGDPLSDSTEPPRSAPLPYPPLPHSAVVKPVVERLQAAGASVSAIPRGLDYGPQGKCVLCPTCDGYYCQLDAKWDAENAVLRPAIRTGNVDVLLHTHCKKILTDDAGKRASGIVIKHDENEYTVMGDHIVVAAGLPDSMMLLWQSRNQQHPAGLGNSSGNLGKHLGGHSVGIVFPFINWLGMPANHTKTFSISNYYNGAPHWKYPMGIIQVAGQMPYWRLASRLMRVPARMVAKRSLMCFFMIEAIPTAESGFKVTAESVSEKIEPVVSTQTFEKAREYAADIFRRAGYYVLARKNPASLWHETGTARMGNDPATSVCNSNCEVHDISNLYVTDASVLPTAGAVNTCLTIVAVALRAADAILAKK